MKITDMSSIKVGDSVFVGTVHKPQLRIENVFRLTDTQIITREGINEWRYLRKSGCSAKSYSSHRITGIVTEQELSEFQTAKKLQKEEQNRLLEESRKLDDKRQELNALFNERAYVRKEGEGWIVEFQPMTEAAVREFAEKLHV